MTDLHRILAADPDLLAGLEAAPVAAVEVPDDDDLVAELVRLTVPYDQIEDVLALATSMRNDTEYGWLLERFVGSLLERLGPVSDRSPLPTLPEALGPVRSYLFAYVFVLVAPHTRRFHRSRGVPAEVTEATLADLGRSFAVHRSGTGRLGLPPRAGEWLWLHLTGQLYDLGRLQFQRARLGRRTGAAVHADGLTGGADDPTLSVHIPRFKGPLTPAACDSSFRRAPAFFAAHFPEEPVETAVCRSWLLDRTLDRYLRPESNIVAFQRRFRPVYDEVSDTEPLSFVFGRSGPLDGLPQETNLQRALVSHLRAGEHWHVSGGWLRL